MVTYWQDMVSGAVISFETKWDADEMKNNPEYKQIDEKTFKAKKTENAKPLKVE